MLGEGCWDVANGTHEVGHLLGAVQPSAPHGTSGLHCTDGVDPLCQPDGSGAPVEAVCEGDGQVRLDCHGDDWFHPAPPDGSYLASHWNAANSGFVIGAAPLPRGGGEPLGSTVVFSEPDRSESFDVLVVSSSPSGTSGDFSATPPAPLASHQVGLFTGGAELGYDVPVPPASAGPAPQVSLGYSSTGIDGMNHETNNQSGPVGLGWSLSTASVTRIVEPCDDGYPGDRCSAGDEYSIQLNGVASRLVHLSGDEYRLRDDPGWRVVRKAAGGSNGDHRGHWWEVTDTSGTVYELGRTAAAAAQLPLHTDDSACGAAGDMCVHVRQWWLESITDTSGNQVAYGYEKDRNFYDTARPGPTSNLGYDRDVRLLEVRYGTHDGSGSGNNARVLLNWEWRCGYSNTFGDCTWPGSFVDVPTDLRCASASVNCGQSTPTFWSMHRLGSIQTQVVTRLESAPYDDDWVTVATHDLFQDTPVPVSSTGETSERKTVLQRVFRREGGDYETYGFAELGHGTQDGHSGIKLIGGDVDGKPAWASLKSANGVTDYIRWEDVYLGGGMGDAKFLNVRYSAVDGASDVSVRLDSPTGTEIGRIVTPSGGTGGWVTQTVDIADVSGVRPVYLVGTGATSIVLSWIRFSPGSARFHHVPALPPVDYAPVWLPNRVNAPAGVSPMDMARIGTATTSLGATVDFTYDHPIDTMGADADCTTQPSEWNGIDWSTARMHCYPKFTSVGGDSGFVNYWKWVVTAQTVTDGPVDDYPTTTTYGYHNPAFALADGPGTDPATRTRSDFRGHARVSATTHGVVVESRFFQGMHGQPDSSGGTQSVTVTRLDGATYTDSDWLAGRRFDHGTSQGTARLSRTLVGHGVVGVTAGSGADAARLIRPTDEWVYSDMASGWTSAATTRRTVRVYNQWGQPTVAKDYGDTSDGSDNRNTRWYYTVNTAAWILDTVKTEILRTGLADTGTVLSQTTSYYDGKAHGDPPTAGLLTSTCAYVAATGCGSTNRTEHLRDARGRQTRVRLPLASGNLDTHTAYDPLHGWVTSRTNAEGHQTVTSHDAHGRPTAVTDPNGNTTTVSHDGYGRLTQVFQPSDVGTSIPTAEYSYFPHERPPRVRQQSKLSGSTRLDAHVYHDGFGRQLQTQTNQQTLDQRTVTTTRYDHFGRPDRVSLPIAVSVGGNAGEPANNAANGYWKPQASWATVVHDRTTYDGIGRVTKSERIANSGAAVQTTSHTHDGYVTKTTDPSGDVVWRTEDARGNPVIVEEFTGSGSTRLTTTYTHDSAGRLLQIVPPGGTGAVSMTYDLRGRKLSMSDPDLGDWTYTYDGASRLTSQTDGSGQSIHVTHDRLGRPLAERDGSPTGPTLASWTYDDVRVGAPATATAHTPHGDVVRSSTGYSPDGQVTEETLTVPGPGGGSFSRAWSHDAAGNVVSRTTPDGEVVTSTYDPRNGRLATSTSSQVGPLVTDTVYDQMHRVDTRYHGVAFRDHDYDFNRGWLVDTEGWASSTDKVFDVGLAYEADGQLRHVVDGENGNQAVCLDHDGLDRLTAAYTATTACGGHDPAVGQDGFDHAYGYDTAGRVATATGPDGTARAYTYSATAPHAVTAVGTDTFGYDATGSMTSRTVDGVATTMAYDSHRRLETVTAADGTTTDYLYDTTGTRVATIGDDQATVYVGDWERTTDLTAASNLLADGGFETTGGWTHTESAVFPATTNQTGQTGPRTGGDALVMTNAATTSLDADPVTVAPATGYTLSGWRRGFLGAQSAGGWQLVVDEYDTGGTQVATTVVAAGDDTTASSDTWTQESAGFTTTATTATVVVRIRVDQVVGRVTWDDMALVAAGTTTNLLPDPGFETGDGWTGTAAGAAGVYRSTWGPMAGRTGAGWLLSNLGHGRLTSDPFPVTAGAAYDLSVQVRGEMDPDQTDRFGLGRIWWRDTAGDTIGYSNPVVVQPDSLDETWATVSGQATAPAGATSAYIELHGYLFTGWITFDDVSMSTGGGTNLVPDPSFEARSWTPVGSSVFPGTSMWQSSYGTASPADGTYAGQVSNLGYGWSDADPVDIDPDRPLHTSAWIRGETDTTESMSIAKLYVRWYDTAGTVVGGQTVATIDGSQLDTDWQQLAATTDPPAGATRAQVRLYGFYLSGWVAFDDVAATQDTPTTTTTTHYPGTGYATDGQLTIAFTDHLGSTAATWTPDTGQTAARRYLPYGGIRHDSGIDTDIGYTGQRTDQPSGLMYYQARWYDPTIGRFTQPDTIIPDPGLSADLDRYAYVRNNPYRYTDPTGHIVCEFGNCRPDFEQGIRILETAPGKTVKGRGGLSAPADEVRPYAAGTFPVEHHRETLHAAPLRATFAQARIDRTVRYILSQIQPVEMPSDIALMGQVVGRVVTENPIGVLIDNIQTRPADTLKSFGGGVIVGGVVYTGGGLLLAGGTTGTVGAVPAAGALTASEKLLLAGAVADLTGVAAQTSGELMRPQPCGADVGASIAASSVSATLAAVGSSRASFVYSTAGGATSFGSMC